MPEYFECNKYPQCCSSAKVDEGKKKRYATDKVKPANFYFHVYEQKKKTNVEESSSFSKKKKWIHWEKKFLG